LRKVIVVILLAVLAGYWAIYGRLPGFPADDQGNGQLQTRHTTLRKSFAIDLESGSIDASSGNKRDLWWQMKTPAEEYLCPFLTSHAMLAPLPEDEYMYIGATGLAALNYSNKGFRYSKTINGVYPGLTLAVRTGDGNYAKVRVNRIVMDDQLDLEWQLFQPLDEASGTMAVVQDKLKTAGRYVRYQLSRFSIIELVFMIFFTIVGALIIFMLLFGKRLSSKEFWHRELEIALNNNATSFRVEAGKPLQIKINGEWKESRFPIESHEFSRLQMFIDEHSRDWIMHGAGTASVIRNDADLIEWELNPNRNV